MSFDFSGKKNDLRHPAQRKMWQRIQFTLSQIEEWGKEGVDEQSFIRDMFLNGYGEPCLVKKYITYLIDMEKIKRQGERLFSSNYTVKEEESGQTRLDSDFIHTDTQSPASEGRGRRSTE